MPESFKIIGLTGKPRYSSAFVTHEYLYNWLTEQGYSVIVDQDIAKQLNCELKSIANLEQIGQQADLVVVIGGDGNMLSAARILSHFDCYVIGVNRGTLGFLTDLNPDNVLQHLDAVLKGHYVHERRFLLEACVYNETQHFEQSVCTVNEVVLHPGKIAHMIEFEVYIDQRFAFSLRSDGLIIATPTGSTAYSLSAGGPILVPSLDAINLVPMFPHILTSRPIVINANSIIQLRFPDYTTPLELSCDGQVHLPIAADEQVTIRRCQHHLNLIHPREYNYFNTLSTKLQWSKKII